MAKESDIFVGLDIGTTEVRCVVGASGSDNSQSPQVLGIGIVSNSGMKKGNIIHKEGVAEAIDTALGDVERTTGRRISAVTVNVNGVHIQSRVSSGIVAIGNPEGIIYDEDLFRVQEDSRSIKLPEGREIIQLFPSKYKVDGRHDVKNPVGLEGQRLEVESFILAGSSPALRTIEAVCSDSGVAVNNKVVSSLAVIEAALANNAREHALAITDIGATTTNLLVMNEGEIIHTAVIPIGGFNITSDLARGLQVSIDVAELIKKEYVDLNSKNRGTKTETFGKEKISFSMDEVTQIIEPRLEEFCQEIQTELKKAGYARRLPGGLMLAGGGSKLVGMPDFLKRELKIYVHRAELSPTFSGLTESVDKPEYIVATGLMALDKLLSNDTDLRPTSGISVRFFLNKINNLLRLNKSSN